MEPITSGETLDCSDPLNPTYSIEGTHDGFPAHEIYLDRQGIHAHDPVENGNTLGDLSPLRGNYNLNRQNERLLID